MNAALQISLGSTPGGRLRSALGVPGATHVLADAGDLRAVLDELDDLTQPAPPAMGRPPYGWRSPRGELVPNQDELRQLRIARDLRAGGATTWGHVADVLTEAGLYAREGRPWTAASIARAVARANS